MTIFDPSKLSVQYSTGAALCYPLLERKYTLTHSDETGQLYVVIGTDWDRTAIDPNFRDEVLAEWIWNGEYALYVYVYITGGEFNDKAATRYSIFKKELPLALTAILYGDSHILNCWPQLLHAPIYIRFISVLPEYDKLLYFGTPADYRTNGRVVEPDSV